MRVLVTRPSDAAEGTARRLRLHGHEPILAPLLEIHFSNPAGVDLEGVYAILATSSNGIRAFARSSRRRDLPVLAVGAHTATIARQLGFAAVQSADADAQALARAVTMTINPDSGVLLHAAGAETSGVLAHDLTACGFTVRSVALYRTIAASELPVAAQQALRSKSLGAALFYSPRTGRVFAELVTRAGLEAYCRSVVACSISAATAATLQSLPFHAIRAAEHPDEDRLLALL